MSLLYSAAVGGRAIPLLILLTVTLVLRAMGVAGVAVMDSWLVCLRGGLAAMFLLTASAHWGKRRPDLIRMVPAAFPRPDLIVTADSNPMPITVPNYDRNTDRFQLGMLIAITSDY